MFKRIFSYKRMYLLLGFPVGLLLTLAAMMDSTRVEYLYAKGLHLFFEKTVGAAVSLLPFSLTEWLIAAAVLGAAYYIGFVVYSVCRNRAAWKHICYKAFVNVLCTASLAYFLFVITMGLNYYRYSVTEYLDLSTREYSAAELKEVCMWLAKGATENRALLSEDGNGVSVLQDESWWQTSAEAKQSFNAISDRYPGVGKLSARNKPMVFSNVMSRTLTMGVYFPYTFESNINVDMTAYTVPFTMCHELSHVKGFMREDEANFLGFLACMNSDRADFRYSGYMSALEYALGQLAQVDRAAAVEVAQTVSDGLRRDESADSAYWDKYRHTVISETTDKIYDTYLQANNQTDGVRSYGRMVDLVIAWYQTEESK